MQYEMTIARRPEQPDFGPGARQDYLAIVYGLNRQGITFGGSEFKARALKTTIENCDEEKAEKVKSAFAGWGEITYKQA